MEDWPEIENFIRTNSFATLVSTVGSKPWATHLPVELEENSSGENVLRGHLSKANVQWKNFSTTETVLVIFHGPHHYISASWYNHVNVPTWNYIAVHIYGKIRIMDDEELLDSLKNLVNRYETISKNPVSVETMPRDFVQKEMKGIVGFEISIEKIEGKWKLSQNRDDENYKNVIRELELLQTEEGHAVATEMRKLRHLE
jgi:transcriptional regulator